MQDQVIEPAGPESRPAEPVEPAPRRRPGAVVALLVVAVVTSGLVSAGVATGILNYQERTNPQTVSLGSNVRITEESAVITVAARAAPAVVTVVTDETSNGPALGSGFLTTSDGYVITNTRVLAGARTVTLLLPGDLHRHDARIVDADCQTGLAVLKVDGVKGLPTLAFANAATLAVGQTVIAMGSPMEPRYAVSRGIVSALHRTLDVSVPTNLAQTIQLSDIIETDANIGSGASGGPLLNVGGQVVGISVVVTGGSDTSSFALSAADIQSEAEQIIRDGTLVVPSLGAGIETVSPETAALRGSTEGALVRSLVKFGPADLAGVRVGDMITALDEVKITSSHPLGQLLRGTRYHPDQRVTLGLVRGGDATQVQLTLGREHPACS